MLNESAHQVTARSHENMICVAICVLGTMMLFVYGVRESELLVILRSWI